MQDALPRSPELMNREDSALLVIDMQEKLLAVVPNRARLVWNARRLLDAAAALGVPVAGTEQYPERLSPTVSEIKDRLGAVPDKLCVQRRSVRRDLRALEERWSISVLLVGIECTCACCKRR